MKVHVITPRSFQGMVLFSLILGSTLMVGFLPTSQTFFGLFSGFFPGVLEKWGTLVTFPLLALIFAVSLPTKTIRCQLDISPWKTLLVPIFIAWLFGRWMDHPSIATLAGSAEGRNALIWTAISIPIGEECLFRGWVYQVSERLWPKGLATRTNPLPTGVWVSAIAFSLWHFQNLGTDPWLLVTVQVGYTLITGFWLGFLRYLTGNIALSIVAHICLNLATHLI